MSQESRTVRARCLCGEAEHEVTLLAAQFPLQTYFCHCNSCRHHTGTLCLTVAFAPKDYQPAPEVLQRLQQYQFSKRIVQYFCSTCGTKMFLHALLEPENPSSASAYGIPTGTLDQADGVITVLGHEHIQDTLDGGFSDFVPSISGTRLARWPGNFEEHEPIPEYWKSPNQSSNPRPDDRLRGHCKCGNVEFWIARPSERSANVQAGLPDAITGSGKSTEQSSRKEAWWLRDNGRRYMAAICSCNSCRLASGMEWVEWAFVPTIDISLDAEGKEPFRFDFGSLKCYRSSSEARRYFCGSCGAMIFWDGDDRPELKDVAVGSLAAPEGAKAESWLEWSTGRLSFREDALARAETLTLAIEEGMAAYGRRLEMLKS